MPTATVVNLAAVERFRRAKELEWRIKQHATDWPVKAETSWQGEDVVVRTEMYLPHIVCVSITRYASDGTVQGPTSHAEERTH